MSKASDILKIGKFVVFYYFKNYPNKQNKAVFFITSDFPVSDFVAEIDRGSFKIREATKEEEEYCYFCFDKTGCNGADLSGLPMWLEYKKNN